MDAKVTVEGMTAALNDVINYVPHRDPTIALMAARDYIIAAESQIAELTEAGDKTLRAWAEAADDRDAKQEHIEALKRKLAERDAQIAELRLSYVPQDIANECREMLHAAGFGQPGSPNTLWAMVKAACAQIAHVELSLRKEWWLNHGCHISALYGDDGEMQCGMASCMKDFKRDPLESLAAHVWQRRMAKAEAELGLTEANQ